MQSMKFPITLAVYASLLLNSIIATAQKKIPVSDAFSTKVAAYWQPLGISLIAELDSAAYNRRLDLAWKQAEKYIDDNSHKVPAANLNSLRRYNHFLRAKSYTEYALYKRLTDPNRLFNFTDSNYLKPLEPLIYSSRDLQYSYRIQEELIQFSRQLRKVNFETRLLEKDLTNCELLRGQDLLPHMYGTSCKMGYRHGDYWITEPMYDYAENFAGKYAIVAVDGRYGLINTCGETVIKPYWGKLSWISDRLLLCKNNDLTGLINVEAKILIPPTYTELSRFREYAGGDPDDPEGHIALFAEDPNTRKNGLINSSGRIIIPFEYSNLMPVSPEFILYQISDSSGLYATGHKLSDAQLLKTGVINSSGQVVIPHDFQEIHYEMLLKEPHFLITKIHFKKEKKSWWRRTYSDRLLYNVKGELIYPGSLHYAVSHSYGELMHTYIFTDSYTAGEQDFQVFSKYGHPFLNRRITTFGIYNRNTVVTTDDGQMHLVRDDSTSTVAASFDTFRPMYYYDRNNDEDFAWDYIACRKGKCAALDKDLNFLSGFLYDEILNWKNYPIVRQDGKLYILDSAGRQHHPQGFDAIKKLNHQTWQARHGNEVYIFDKDFRLLFKVAAQALFSARSQNKEDVTVSPLFSSPLLALKDDHLYKLSGNIDSLIYSPVVPGRLTLLNHYSHRKTAMFLLNENGLVIWNAVTKDSRDSWDLVKPMLIDADKILVYSENGRQKLVNIRDGKSRETEFLHLTPVYDLQSAVRSLSIHEQHGKSREHKMEFQKILYYIVHLPTGKAGALDTGLNIRLDTIYSAISHAGGNILAFEPDPASKAKKQEMGNGNSDPLHTLSVFNRQLQLIAKFENVYSAEFIKDHVISISFPAGNEVYRIHGDLVESMNSIRVSFEEYEPLYWAQRKDKHWNLLDLDGNPVSQASFEYPGQFRYGIASMPGVLVVKNGILIQNNFVNYSPQHLSSDLQQVLFSPLPEGRLADMKKKEKNFTFRSMENFSGIKFSDFIYQSDSGLRKDPYVHVFRLADDPGYPAQLNRAVNLAFIRMMCRLEAGIYHTFDFTFMYRFTLYSNELFRLHKPFDEYHKNDPLYSDLSTFLIMNDSLFEINGKGQFIRNEFDAAGWEGFNVLFYSRLGETKGLSSAHSHCANPAKAIDHYAAKMGLTADSVSFIINHLEVYGQQQLVTISFSYAEMLPWLDKSKLVYRWIKRSGKEK
jgi:hypothetical protein